MTGQPPRGAPREHAGRRPFPGKREPAHQPAPGRVSVAVVRRPWGTDGSVAVGLFATDSGQLLPGKNVYVGNRRAEVLSARRAGRSIAVRFDIAGTIGEAEMLRGAVIEIQEADLPPLSPGAFYHHQIVGASVLTVAGEELGSVSSIIESGSYDVYVVTPNAGDGRDILVPALQGVVIDVDVERGIITVDLPEGLR